jgi:hypothetical protein
MNIICNWLAGWLAGYNADRYSLMDRNLLISYYHCIFGFLFQVVSFLVNKGRAKLYISCKYFVQSRADIILVLYFNFYV